MHDFIWILGVEKQSALGREGISTSYIIPKNEMHSNVARLSEAVLWVALRSDEIRSIAVITIKQIEQFSEGYHEGDFLITTDLTASIRFTSSYETAKDYRIHFDATVNGIYELSPTWAESLKHFIEQKIETRFKTPPENVLKNRLRNSSVVISGPESAIAEIVGKFNLDQLWGSGMGLKLTPVINFAYTILSWQTSGANDSEILEELQSLDPLRNLRDIFKTPNSDPPRVGSRRLKKSTDLIFTRIDPNNIFARTFIGSNKFILDLEAALNKTDTAEKLHQSMLRDISGYLEKKSIISYETTSIDLMVKIESGIKIFEIKSANVENLVSQAAKGAFQIACYMKAMEAEFPYVTHALILQEVNDENLGSFVFGALDLLHIKYLVYRPNVEWPDRVEGLLNI